MNPALWCDTCGAVTVHQWDPAAEILVCVDYDHHHPNDEQMAS